MLTIWRVNIFCLSILQVFDGIQVIFTTIIGFVTWTCFVLNTDKQERWPSEPSSRRNFINIRYLATLLSALYHE